MRAELEAMLGTPQVLIKQVIMYHECTCDHLDMSVESSSQPKMIERVLSRERLICGSENSLANDGESAWSRELASLKAKSKSNLSLASILEINVFMF